MLYAEHLPENNTGKKILRLQLRTTALAKRLYNVLAVENTKRHNAFAAILWASLPAMLRQNSSSHLACGTISAHLHRKTCFKRALYAPAASHPTTYLADRMQKN